MKELIEYLEKEISDLMASNATMNAAANTPFGNRINLAEAAQKYLKDCEARIAVEIWQKHRIKVLQAVLEKAITMKQDDRKRLIAFAHHLKNEMTSFRGGGWDIEGVVDSFKG